MPTATLRRAQGKPAQNKEKKATPKVAKKVAPVAKASDNNFAIIMTGGKQYRVTVGDTIKIEILKGEYKVGDSIKFDQVLLTDNGANTVVGTPLVAGVVISGNIAEIGRSKKVLVIKYKQKSRYFKKNGHRQPYFKVKIDKIS